MKKPNREDYSSGAHGEGKFNKAMARYKRAIAQQNEKLHPNKPSVPRNKRGRALKIKRKDRMTRLPGGSVHEGGEIGRKSTTAGEGKFRTLEVKNKQTPFSEAGKVEQQDKMTPAQTKKSLELHKNREKEAKASEWKPSAIQKKLMKGGWTKEELQAKQKAHKQWKADRKSGKLKIKNKDRK